MALTYTNSDVECTGPVGEGELVLAGLNPFTADLVRSAKTNFIANGPFTVSCERDGHKPCWSAARLLSLLPFTDDFYWSLTRREFDEKFVLTVFTSKVKGGPLAYVDERLINVVLPAIQNCLDTRQMPAKYTKVEAYRRRLAHKDSPTEEKGFEKYLDSPAVGVASIGGPFDVRSDIRAEQPTVSLSPELMDLIKTLGK